MKKTTIYWRDIPSQLVLQQGRVREKAQLSPRFQKAIDRAAMRAGKGSSDAYLAEWRRVVEKCESQPDLRAHLDEQLRHIEAEFSDERLDELVRSRGVSEG